MKIAIITSLSTTSARKLAEHLQVNNIQADVFRPYKDGRKDFRNYDYVFSYGCSAITSHKERINQSEAVSRCIDKISTFKALEKLPIPRWWARAKDVPEDAFTVVVRADKAGNKATGLEYWYRDSGKPLPEGELYTEYFYHKRGYRVVVFDERAFVYYKHWNKEDDSHEFRLQRTSNFSMMAGACLVAAKRLGIDFVAFDVVANDKHDFVILEANSGGILTDEVSTAIVEYFLNK